MGTKEGSGTQTAQAWAKSWFEVTYNLLMS